MLELVDAYIEAQLKRVTLSDVPVTVYTYMPDRDKGETVRPFYAFERAYFRRDKRKPVGGDMWIPSEETATLTFPAPTNVGGDTTITGPVSWTRKPNPTTVKVYYIIYMESSIEAQALALQELVFQAFPPEVQPHIGDCYPLFLLGDMMSHDDRSKPIFSKTIPLEVQEVKIARLESETVQSIITPILDSGIEEYSPSYGAGGYAIPMPVPVIPDDAEGIAINISMRMGTTEEVATPLVFAYLGQAISTFFDPDNIGIGQDLVFADLAAACSAVEGIAWLQFDWPVADLPGQPGHVYTYGTVTVGGGN